MLKREGEAASLELLRVVGGPRALLENELLRDVGFAGMSYKQREIELGLQLHLLFQPLEVKVIEEGKGGPLKLVVRVDRWQESSTVVL